jgi:thiamine transport system substrate-binding protein
MRYALPAAYAAKALPAAYAAKDLPAAFAAKDLPAAFAAKDLPAAFAAIALPAVLAAFATPLLAQTPELTIYTYDSFVAEWGPGPVITAAFEAECACTLTFVTAGDGAALLSRLLLEGAGTPADLVIGLDNNLVERARASGLFAPHNVAMANSLPVVWDDPVFLPYDWGWFAFVARADLANPPASLRALADSDLQIVIQDPRSSTPGLGLVMWVKAAYPDEAAALWADLADNIVTVTPGWSESYGLFLEGEADAVLSYSTSPAYHLIAEGDAGFQALAFDEGHGLQVEVAAMLAGTDQPELAQAFLTFLAGPVAQAALPTTNWMYPAFASPQTLPDGFATLIDPETVMLSPEQAEAQREAAVEEWRLALIQ